MKCSLPLHAHHACAIFLFLFSSLILVKGTQFTQNLVVNAHSVIVKISDAS